MPLPLAGESIYIASPIKNSRLIEASGAKREEEGSLTRDDHLHADLAVLFCGANERRGCRSFRGGPSRRPPEKEYKDAC